MNDDEKRIALKALGHYLGCCTRWRRLEEGGFVMSKGWGIFRKHGSWWLRGPDPHRAWSAFRGSQVTAASLRELRDLLQSLDLEDDPGQAPGDQSGRSSSV